MRTPRLSIDGRGVFLTLLLIFGAVFSGLVVAFVGNAVGIFSLIYLGALILVISALSLLLAAKNPVHRVTSMALIALPIIGYSVPPRRFAVSLLEVILFVLLILILWKRLWRTKGGHQDELVLFPARSLIWVQVLLLPSVIFSMYPLVSVGNFVLNFCLYLLFIAFVNECLRAPDNDHLLRMLIYGTIVLGVGVALDRATGVNLALEVANSNQLSIADGTIVTRARGFFGDPQKAAQFMACAGCFLTVLLVRRRFARQPRLRWLAIMAVLISLVALVLTGSRGALLAMGFGLSAGFLLFNPWSLPVKLMTGLLVGVVATVALQLPLGVYQAVVPRSVAARFAYVDQSAQERVKIWFDTWRMFADQPLQGIGLGSFRSYMAESSSVTRNFYGIGSRSGGDVYIPNQPESGYFKILYEGGLLGSLAALILLGATLARFFVVLHSRTLSADKKSEAIAAMTSLTVFAITFVTLFTISERRIVVLLALMMAFIWAPSLSRPRAANSLPAGRSGQRS